MKFETHYVKSNDFKTVQSNGVFGGLTPQGQINANFFTERAPIPKKIILDLDEETGDVRDEVEREGKEGVVREVHFGVMMDISTAKSFVKWLDDKIKLFEQSSLSKESLKTSNKKQSSIKKSKR